MHHRVGKRHGYRRGASASFGETVAGYSQRGVAGRLSGRRDARAATARRREISQYFWRNGSGARGGCGDFSTFGAWRAKRIVAVVIGIQIGTAANFSGAWRAAGAAIL